MTTNAPRPQPHQRPPRWRGPALRAALLALAIIALLEVLGLVALEDLLPGGDSDRRAHFITDASAPLAAFYTPEVLHWQDEIREWARTYQVNPNVLAIVIQIESCGDATAISSAGALGLMQVMPFHFEYGENMINPETNVQRGMEVFHECLTVFAGYDLGLALACYNGGPGVTQRRYQEWYPETRYYYDWATGLWQDVQAGATKSETLTDWLAAGGQRLCDGAARSQQATAAALNNKTRPEAGALRSCVYRLSAGRDGQEQVRRSVSSPAQRSAPRGCPAPSSC